MAGDDGAVGGDAWDAWDDDAARDAAHDGFCCARRVGVPSDMSESLPTVVGWNCRSAGSAKGSAAGSTAWALRGKGAGAAAMVGDTICALLGPRAKGPVAAGWWAPARETGMAPGELLHGSESPVVSMDSDAAVKGNWGLGGGLGGATFDVDFFSAGATALTGVSCAKKYESR